MNEISPKPNDSELTTSSDDDYNLIEQALLQNPRGRWFLEEYVSRQRPEDTKKLLSAIQRIEKNLTKETATPTEDDIDPIRISIIEMSKAIAKTRQEIKSIKPANEADDQIINATGELSAIVQSTETATNTILEAAEEIQEATWILRESGADEGPCGKIEDRTTDIYTACSFQDITGQRTTKVVQALSYIESRVNAMIEIWGMNDLVHGEVPIEGDVDIRPDAHLLHGPSSEGEGVEQIDIDDMSFDSITASPAEAIDPNDMNFDAIEVVSDDVVEAAELQVPDETIEPETSDAMELPVELTAEAAVDLSVETAEIVEDTGEVLGGTVETSEDMAVEAPESSLIEETGEVDLSSDEMNIRASIDEVGPDVGELNVTASVALPAEENEAEALASPEIESPVEMTGAIEDEVALDETATVVDSNEEDGAINLGDIEVADLDIIPAISPSENSIDPALDAPSIDIELDATQEKEEEKLEMGEIETQVADTPNPMATNMIASPEELEVIEEIDVDALSDNQKDMILN